MTSPQNNLFSNTNLQVRDVSLVDQIVSHTIQTIKDGELQPGSRLPSIRSAAEELGVNRNTVAQAYRELAEKGYVETRFGGGSYVSSYASKSSSLSEQNDMDSHALSLPLEITEGDLELRFSQRLNASTGSLSKHHILGLNQADTINLFQLRPNTDIFPLELFRKCLNTVLRRSGKSLLSYGSPAGYMPLREQIAGRMRRSGIVTDPDNILITSGSQQGIDLLARAFVDPGDTVVVESPTYTNAIRIFSGHGARLMPFAIERNGIALQSLEGFQFQASPKFFYTVPYFQNPTTHSYTLAEKQALLQQVYKAGSLLVEDAYYSEMHPDPGPAMAALDRSGRVIYLNTFSKTMVPAVRVGFMHAPAVLARKLTELKEMTDLSHSLILQAGITEFMERGYFDEHLTRVKAFYKSRLAQVTDWVEKYLPAEISFTPPPGGLFFWLDLPPSVDGDHLALQLQNDGVLVSPASLFHPLGGGRNGIRLCVAHETEERVEKAIQILGSRITKMLSRPTSRAEQTEYQGTH